jgi:hypothetical protein
MDEFDISIAGEKQKIHDAEREAEEKRIEAEEKRIAAREMELAAKEKAINDFYHFFTLELLKGINKHLDSLNDGTFDHDNSITKIQGMNYRKEYFISVREWDGILFPATNSIDDLFYVVQEKDGLNFRVGEWLRLRRFGEFEEYWKIIQEPLLENYFNARFMNEEIRKRFEGKAGILDTCARIMSEMGIILSWEIPRYDENYEALHVIGDVTGSKFKAGDKVDGWNPPWKWWILRMDMNYSKVIHVDYFHSYYAEIMNSIREKINLVHQKDIAKEAEMARKLQASIDAENKKKKKRKEQVNKVANRLLNRLDVSEKIKDAISIHQNDLIITTSVKMKDDYQKSEEAGVLAWGDNMGLNLLGLNFGREDWRRKRRNELNAMEELLFSIKVEEVIEECIAILKSKKIFVTKSEQRSRLSTEYANYGYESRWYIKLELNW